MQSIAGVDPTLVENSESVEDVENSESVEDVEM